MSGSGGVSIVRSRGENRFYVSPGMRQKQQQQRLLISKNYTPEMDKRGDSDQCGSSLSSSSLVVSNCSVSGWVGIESNYSSTNLDRFLEFATLVVPAQHFPKGYHPRCSSDAAAATFFRRL
ncbi:uncharacterized protein LOC126686101 [Mercurialis annua]|uniref:uncharacterized protein LOC126686101 n=1 Tax=Mercurialis annua TaxID=3986 RepID=UPI00215F37AB|nr:uncharacterized protein LOC126686101 [Mercurialis annua]XP_050236087.1 uncharacterized protein LOC126686101 [Mercurialis annua]XP_055962426.1 uncharacterized protein LOC126686101 [Mercurialis annua]